MTAGVRLGWRVATAVAFAATAALAVTLTRGAPMHAALTSARHDARVAPRCVTSGLHISMGTGTIAISGLGRGPGGLTVTRYPLDFTNVSGAACSLAGYPQVVAFRGNGVPVGNAAAADTAAPVHRVVLAPGETARAAVVVAAVRLSAGGCRPVVAAGLRVAPPGQADGSYLRRSLLACSGTGPRAPDALRVIAVQPAPAVRPD
jgi:hypothetical protein